MPLYYSITNSKLYRPFGGAHSDLCADCPRTLGCTLCVEQIPPALQSSDMVNRTLRRKVLLRRRASKLGVSAGCAVTFDNLRREMGIDTPPLPAVGPLPVSLDAFRDLLANPDDDNLTGSQEVSLGSPEPMGLEMRSHLFELPPPPLDALETAISAQMEARSVRARANFSKRKPRMTEELWTAADLGKFCGQVFCTFRQFVANEAEERERQKAWDMIYAAQLDGAGITCRNGRLVTDEQ